MADVMADAIANRMANVMAGAWQNYAPNPNPNPNPNSQICCCASLRSSLVSQVQIVADRNARPLRRFGFGANR
jgi:hypothetical protein